MTSLKDLLNQSSFDFYFLVVDKFLDIQLPELKNFVSIYSSSTDPKNSGALLSKATTLELISQKQAQTHRTPAIVSFKPSAKIEKICQKHGWAYINNPAHLNRLLENKLKFSELCQNNNLPVIPSSVDTFNQANFAKFQNIYGPKLVLQTHFGWAGQSTFWGQTWSEVSDRLPIDSLVKYSPYLPGYTLINNCCQTRFGLIQSPPGLQFTGIKPLTENPFTTVGRQWPCLSPLAIQDKIRQITSDFSNNILQPQNYKGFFGLDFLVSGNQVYLLECNPRLTASFAFYTDIETKAQLTPLFYFHLAEFINVDYSLDSVFENQRFSNPKIVGSELVKKNQTGQTIKKINDYFTYSSSNYPPSIDSSVLNQLNG
ncbi:MAG: ATP-grasp domain-containing protein [Candidatus Shapirobacteria bacterium]